MDEVELVLAVTAMADVRRQAIPGHTPWAVETEWEVVSVSDGNEEASIALTQRSGFREYYDPRTGEGFGAEGFSWSALVLDMAAPR